MTIKTRILNNRILNSTKAIYNVITNHLTKYPAPSTLNYAWSFGSLVGIYFALQLFTGIMLAMHYTAHIDWAFISVDHIMVDVKYGYIFRYAHANGASFIFILLYLHIGRALYFQSYVMRPKLWISGIVIFLLMMGTAFIGYVLPWGQMSFWGATVITSLVTAVPFVGEDIAYWIWGGFSINNATLVRFFSIHYLLPFIITALVVLHLILLHIEGSSDPVGLRNTPDKIEFHPYYTYKDAFILLVSLFFFTIIVFFYPNVLGHSDNFIPANPLVTPAHIVPEWYFTPFYAILRACPDKIGGAIGMLLAIVSLLFIPFYIRRRSNSNYMVAPMSDTHKVCFWFFIGTFFMLLYLGSNPAAAPFIVCSKIFTILYFLYFILVIPFLTIASEHDNSKDKDQE